MSELEQTRRALHAVAEQLMAGPQHRASGTIRLRVRDRGFGTVTEPDVRVEGGDVIAGRARLAIDGMTVSALAERMGLDAGAPQGVYPAQSLAADAELHVDAVLAAKLAEAFAVGDAALRRLSPGEAPVLWPEHFDVGIRLDDVNYGVSPGDDYLGTPYAYVGVDPVPSDPFWNAPFGATRRLSELPGIDAVVAFFQSGRDRTQIRPPAQ